MHVHSRNACCIGQHLDCKSDVEQGVPGEYWRARLWCDTGWCSEAKRRLTAPGRRCASQRLR